MIKRNFALCVALGVCVMLACAKNDDCDHGDMDSNCSYSEQRVFDYMLFVESWDGSFCSDGCCVMPDIGTKARIGFSIHGMWPEYFDDNYPACCSSNITREMIDETLDNNPAMRDMLHVNWPAMKKCRFVRYETEKHGTCASAVYGEDEAGLLNYWTAIIKLANKFDHEKALSLAGITPSDKTMYKTSEIREAIAAKVGAKVNVACLSSSSVLDEVRVCVKRPTDYHEMINPVIFDCPNPENSCDDKIYYLPVPEIPSGGGCKD